jgi:hypothetical protein
MDDPYAGFRHWALILFWVLFAIGLLLGTAVVTVVASDLTFLERAAVAAWVVLLEVVFIVLVRGLSAEEPWADDAALACCWVVLAFGVTRSVLDLTHASISIPADSLAAAFVITRRPVGSRWPVVFRFRRRLAIALTTALLLTQVVSVAADGLRGSTFLSAESQDLDLQFKADCGVAGPDGAPASIVLTSRWSWARHELFPSSTDGLVFTWFGSSGDGVGDGGYHFAQAVELRAEDGFWQGAGSPSAGMVQAVEANSPASFSVGIDLGTQRMAPGRVSIRLDRSIGDTGDATATHGSLTANVSYVHLGRWRTSSAEATCEW